MSSRGAKGGNSPVGRTPARDPTAKPEVGQGLLGRGDLGPAAGAVPMRTTCVRGIPSICDARVIRGIVHHATVVRIARERLCRSQEEKVQGRMAASRDLPEFFSAIVTAAVPIPKPEYLRVTSDTTTLGDPPALN